MHAHQQRRIAVDAAQPINAPLVGVELLRIERQIDKCVRLAGLGIDIGSRLVSQPAEVVEGRGTGDRLIWLEWREGFIAPMRGEKTGQPRMIRLGQDHGLAVGQLAVDHVPS